MSVIDAAGNAAPVLDREVDVRERGAAGAAERRQRVAAGGAGGALGARTAKRA